VTAFLKKSGRERINVPKGVQKRGAHKKIEYRGPLACLRVKRKGRNEVANDGGKGREGVGHPPPRELGT